MNENYINILGKFLADLLEANKISLKEVVKIMKAFEPVCEDIKSREQLITFLQPFSEYYWELKTLIKQLMDKDHKFN